MPQRCAVPECILSDFHNSFLEHHLFQTTVVSKRFIWEHYDGAGDDNTGDVPRHLLAGRVDEVLPCLLGMLQTTELLRTPIEGEVTDFGSSGLRGASKGTRYREGGALREEGRIAVVHMGHMSRR